MKIEIELTKEEEIYLTTCCIQRVMQTVIAAIDVDYEHLQDLFDLMDTMEPLRYKMADAIFRAKLKALEEKGK